MFGRLEDFANNGLALNLYEGLSFMLSFSETKQLIIDLNTGENSQRGQLWQGIDSSGASLQTIGGGYSPYTISQKRLKNLPTDRITLLQTGDFYASFRVNVHDDHFTITADTIKNGDDLRARWGDDILGLTEDSIAFLIEEILPEFNEWVLEQLLK